MERITRQIQRCQRSIDDGVLIRTVRERKPGPRDSEDESPIVEDRGGAGGNLGIVGGREKFSKALTMLICPLFPPEINALYAASKHRAVTPVYTLPASLTSLQRIPPPPLFSTIPSSSLYSWPTGVTTL